MLGQSAAITPRLDTAASFRQVIDNVPDRWRAFLLTALFTGMRASELRGLRWEDVEALAHAEGAQARRDERDRIEVLIPWA